MTPPRPPAPPALLSCIGLDRQGTLHAARMAFAALLAFAIAAALRVEHAYWAAMPVWVVAQASRGLLLERGFYRLLGTLVGAAAGFALLALPLPTWALLALMSACVAIGGAFVHLLAGVQSYGAMLAGMTVAVVVLPSMHTPEHAMQLAFARVECTIIGVIVVTFVTGYFTPVAQRHAYYLRVRQLAASAASHAAEAVAGRPAAETSAREQQLLGEMSQVDALAHSMAAGSIEGYRRLRHNAALISSSLSLMGAAITLRARRLRGEPVDASLPKRLQALAESLRGASPAHPAQAEPWPEDDTVGAQARLHEAAARLVAAEQALFSPAASLASDDPRSRRVQRVYFKPQRDLQRAIWRGGAAGIATFIVSWGGLLSGWAPAELMALGVCVFSMILGSLPMPQQIVPKLLLGTLVGSLVAVFYRFTIQPHVDGFVPLLLSVAPFIVAGALARAAPRTAMPALDANMSFMLASQAGAAAVDAGTIIGGSAALMASALIVGGSVLLWPDPTNPRLQAVAGSIRRDVLRLLDDRKPKELTARLWHARTGRRLLRLLLDLQRAGLTMETPPGLLATLSLGHAVAGLQDQLARLPPEDPARPQLETVFEALRQFPAGPADAADAASATGSSIHDTAIRQTILDAATAMREGAALLDAARPYAVRTRVTSTTA